MTTALPEVQEQEVIAETDGLIGIVRINRPQALNALSHSVLDHIGGFLERFDRNPDIRCMILTGSERAFAAGADIKELEESTCAGMVMGGQMDRWDRIRRISKPVIAAVSGFALGGGCELAMACDIIVASETAVFGQPEITIGVIPGAGGTQRLPRAVGKSLAMDMILTGRKLTAAEAFARGLVSRVVPVEAFLDEAKRAAGEICRKSSVAVRVAKDAVSRSFETGLDAGLSYERQLFHLLFSTEDQKEGMKAFREKRKPQFKGK